MSARRLAFTLGAVALLTSCGVSPRLYLTVRTEAGSPVDAVEVTVYSPASSTTGLGASPITSPIDPRHPFEMRVLGRAGGERVRITVEGRQAGAPRVREEWIASLPAEGAAYLQLVLWNACVDRTCSTPGTTCSSSGTCIGNEVGALPPAPTDAAVGTCVDATSGACEGTEAGVRDASSEVSAPDAPMTTDAGTDAGVDAGVDAGIDAGRDAGRDAGQDVPMVTDLGVDATTPDAVVDGGAGDAAAPRCPGRSATPMADWTACAGGGWCPTFCGAGGACVHASTLTLGRYHACSLRSDQQVACLGARTQGRLGDGVDATGFATAPALVRDAIRPETIRATVLRAGYDGACAVDAAGALKCWGLLNADPCQLDFVPALAATSAARLRRADAGAAANRFVGVATHETRTCGIVEGGSVRCSSWIQTLPDGSSDVIASPADYPTTDLLRADTRALLTDVAEVAIGTYHACARRADGTVWCWGSNRRAQLGAPLPVGDAGLGRALEATQVAGIRGASALGVGDFFSCAVVGTEVRCWGDGSLGRVGTFAGLVECNDGNECTTSPALVSGVAELSDGAGVAQLAVGSEQACVRLGARGDVWCWGNNDVGQLGLSTSVPFRAGIMGAPVFTGADDVVTGGSGGAAGESWTCAHRASDCTWWCWGRVPGEDPPPADPWRPRPLRWGS